MKQVIVVEGKISEDLLHKFSSDKKSTIISFDYNSHKILKDFNIKHKIIEQYFDENDKSLIEDTSLKLATSWYKDEIISNYLEFEGFNLGTLLELELTPYLLSHIKRVLGVTRIIELENPDLIQSYGLDNYVKKLIKNGQIKIELFKKNISNKLFFDEIQIPIKLGFIKIKIKISRKRYFLLKKILDKIFYTFFKIKADKKLLNTNETILLVDFNTKNYGNFLQSFGESEKNIIILNQRKPAIWDLKSLKIILNSNCKILDMEIFQNNKLKYIKSQNIIFLKNNLEHLWESNDRLKNIFSISDNSFWEIIKEDFKKIIHDRTVESVARMTLLKEFFQKSKIKLILDWAHTGTEEKEINHFSDVAKIPVFCLQHGIMTLNPKFEKYHPLMPVLPKNNEKMCVWGEIMERYLVSHNIDKESIIVTGSPRHDLFFKIPSAKQKSEKVLIASNLFFHSNFNGTDIRAFERFELFLIRILELIKKHNKIPIVKLHATEFFDTAAIVRKVDPSIPIYQEEDILELLESCDYVISMNYSTIILDSLILKKPTLVILPEIQNFQEEDVIKNNAVLAASNLEEIDEKFSLLISDVSYKEELILNGKKFIEKYFSFQGDASRNLSELLMKF